MIDILKPYRMAVASAAVLLYTALPLLTIGGQSALRFDIPQLRLYFFGSSLWIDEFIIVLAAVLSITFLSIWVTLAFGRIWCGWLCPQSILVDLSKFLAKFLAKWLARGSPAGFFLVSFALSVLLGAATVWYFVPPGEFISRMLSLNSGPVEGWSFVVLSMLLWLDTVYLGRVFCTTVCPYAMLQGAMFDKHTMALSYDTRRDELCMGCDACVRACPAGIDLRDGLQAACFSCALCRDACAGKLAQRQEPGLLLHFFGEPGGRARLLRPASISLLVAAMLSALLFVTLVVKRGDVDVLVLPNREFAPRATRDGGALASYILSLTNRTEQEVTLYMSAPAVSNMSNMSSTTLYPEVVVLGPAEHRRVQVVVIMKKPKARVLIEIRSAEGESVFSRAVRVPFIGEVK